MLGTLMLHTPAAAEQLGRAEQPPEKQGVTSTLHLYSLIARASLAIQGHVCYPLCAQDWGPKMVVSEGGVRFFVETKKQGGRPHLGPRREEPAVLSTPPLTPVQSTSCWKEQQGNKDPLRSRGSPPPLLLRLAGGRGGMKGQGASGKQKGEAIIQPPPSLARGQIAHLLAGPRGSPGNQGNTGKG